MTTTTITPRTTTITPMTTTINTICVGDVIDGCDNNGFPNEGDVDI